MSFVSWISDFGRLQLGETPPADGERGFSQEQMSQVAAKTGSAGCAARSSFLVSAKMVRRLPWLTAMTAACGLAVTVMLLSPASTSFPEALSHGDADGFHVVVITLDSTRADRLGCYGYENARTPALDSLAARGIRFADAVSSAPITLPSHASIFTGLVPPKHGVRNNGEYRLTPTVTTLAEVLKAEQYDTAAFVSACDLDARFGLNQGFDLYDFARPTASSESTVPRDERSAEAVTDAALAWIQSRESAGRPFFMWIHYRDPHFPYDAPDAYQSSDSSDPYDAEIAYMDSQIGRLLAELKSAGSWDQTLFVVAGDHGESLGEHGESDHSLLLYGSTQRVPYLLSCPGLLTTRHVVDEVLVGVIDTYPTVLDLLGIELPRPCDGVSLVDATKQDNRTIYMETMAPYLENGWSPLHALRRHRDKYIFAPNREYYSMSLDPNERLNLYDDMSPRTLAARTELENAMAEYLQDAIHKDDRGTTDAEADKMASRLTLLDHVPGTVLESYVDALDPKYLIYTWEEARKANTLIDSGDLDAALDKVRLGLAISPNNRTGQAQIGTIYALQNRPDMAEDAYRRAIRIRPCADLYVSLAQVLVAQNQLEKAKKTLDRAEALDPAHGGIFITRGDICCAEGKIDEGMLAYLKAKRVDPVRFSREADAKMRQYRTASSITG